jgi:hypothetical protein
MAELPEKDSTVGSAFYLPVPLAGRTEAKDEV